MEFGIAIFIFIATSRAIRMPSKFDLLTDFMMVVLAGGSGVYLIYKMLEYAQLALEAISV